jgi:PAS domain S-box-containing protein
MNSEKPLGDRDSGRREAGGEALRLFLLVYLPLFAVLGLVFLAALRLYADQQLAELKVRELAQAEVAASLLGHDFETVSSDLRLLADAPSVRRFVDGGSAEERGRMVELFASAAREKRIYDQIRFLDAGGMEVARVDFRSGDAIVVPDGELQNKSGRYFFRDTLRLGRGEVYVSPLDLNIEQDKIQLPYKPMVRFGMPVFDSRGEKRGVVLLNFYGHLLVNDFRRSMAEGHEAMLLNRDGYWLVAPSPADEWGFMFGRKETFATRHPLAWRVVIAQDRGTILTEEGLFTFRTVYPLHASQSSATGSHLPAGESSRALDEREYFWKVVGFIPAGKLPSASPFRHPLGVAAFAFLAGLFALLAGHLAKSIAYRRLLHRKLEENQARLQEIADTLGEGVFVLDQKGRITFVNPAAQKLLGYAEHELLGRNAHQLFHYQYPDGLAYPEAECLTNRTIVDGRIFRGEETLWDRHGRSLPVAMIAAPILRQGKVTGSVVAIHDIRYLKEVEEELRQLNDNLAQRVEVEVAKNLEQEKLLIQQSRLAVMGEMIGNIAHQWRQPLNALGLLLENVKDAYEYDELDRESLGNSVADGKRLIQKMSSTIDDFRNFFRPHLVKSAFGLRETAEETVRLVEASYLNHNIRIGNRVPADIRASGHANEFSQVLLNLLSNAKDVLVERRVAAGRVEVDARPEAGFAVLTVADNGGGIPPEVLPKIFDAYYTTKESGTGIGLYMSKLIVEHMGGTITAAEGEEGAVFTIRLPLAEAGV